MHSADRCRLHLAERLRAEGEEIPFEDSEIAGLLAAAVQILRVAMNGVPEESFDHDPRTEMDMYAMLDPDADWAIAQMSLDLLGTHISDQFGAMVLSPPMESCRRCCSGSGSGSWVPGPPTSYVRD